MIFVEDKVEYIPSEPGVEGMYKIMEQAARQCYLTFDGIKDGSAHNIIDNRIIPSGHTSILEFGTVYLVFPLSMKNTIELYKEDRYSRVNIVGNNAYVTTTYRTILQGDYKDPIEAIEKHFDRDWKADLKYWSEPTEYHHKRYCFRFTMDRVGSQSVVRHRGVYGIAYAQESTRWICYFRDKFGKEIMVSVPSKLYDLIDKYAETNEYLKTASIDEKLDFLRKNDDGWNVYEHSLSVSEQDYMKLVGEHKWKAEDARGVLNLDIKTQFMMCAYPEDWKMWLYRRNDKHAHPHIQKIAKEVSSEFGKLGIIM